MAHFSNPSKDLTTMWCDTRRLTKMHFPSQGQRLNNTATSPSTAIKFLLKRESRRIKTSTIMANHDPRMNRSNPKNCTLLRIAGTWSTWCDFCKLFVVYVWSCLVCFLNVLNRVLMIDLASQPYKPLWRVKPRIGNLFKKCDSLSPIMSAWVAWIIY
jgi:hypothetical protein